MSELSSVYKLPDDYDPNARWNSRLAQREAVMAYRVAKNNGKIQDLTPEQEKRDFAVFEAKVKARKEADAAAKATIPPIEIPAATLPVEPVATLSPNAGLADEGVNVVLFEAPQQSRLPEAVGAR
jgi:hypothetical protein